MTLNEIYCAEIHGYARFIKLIFNLQEVIMIGRMPSRVTKEKFIEYLDVMIEVVLKGGAVEIELEGDKSVYLVSKELFLRDNKEE